MGNARGENGELWHCKGQRTFLGTFLDIDSCIRPAARDTAGTVGAFRAGGVGGREDFCSGETSSNFRPRSVRTEGRGQAHEGDKDKDEEAHLS